MKIPTNIILINIYFIVAGLSHFVLMTD